MKNPKYLKSSNRGLSIVPFLWPSQMTSPLGKVCSAWLLEVFPWLSIHRTLSASWCPLWTPLSGEGGGCSLCCSLGSGHLLRPLMEFVMLLKSFFCSANVMSTWVDEYLFWARKWDAKWLWIKVKGTSGSQSLPKNNFHSDYIRSLAGSQEHKKNNI